MHEVYYLYLHVDLFILSVSGHTDQNLAGTVNMHVASHCWSLQPSDGGFVANFLVTPPMSTGASG